MHRSTYLPLLLCLAFPASMAQAQNCPPGTLSQIPGLHPTGVDAFGSVLPGGAADPHYSIPLLSAQAVVVTTPDVGWLANDATSKWVWQQFDGLPTNVTLTFRLEFDLTGLNPATASVTGLWSTDNFGDDILINGASTGSTSPTHTAAAPFTITTGFVTGINTLDFIVRDVGLIAGFRILEIDGTACQESTCVAFCNGDGSGTLCPCGNHNDNSAGQAAGCTNGQGNLTGGVLTCVGTASLALGPPSQGGLQLRAWNIRANQPGMFIMGTNKVNGGNGVQFGDGLRCVSAIVRLQIVMGGFDRVALSTVDLTAFVSVSPSVRYYQYWYRDPVGGCGTPNGNLTNGIEVLWLP